MQLNHKELTKHIRNRVKADEINARVKMQTSNEGKKVIVVCVPEYEARFSADEIYKFCVAAKANKLTFVRNTEIDPFQQSQLTEKQQWDFYL